LHEIGSKEGEILKLEGIIHELKKTIEQRRQSALETNEFNQAIRRNVEKALLEVEMSQEEEVIMGSKVEMEQKALAEVEATKRLLELELQEMENYRLEQIRIGKEYEDQLEKLKTQLVLINKEIQEEQVKAFGMRQMHLDLRKQIIGIVSIGFQKQGEKIKEAEEWKAVQMSRLIEEQKDLEETKTQWTLRKLENQALQEDVSQLNSLIDEKNRGNLSWKFFQIFRNIWSMLVYRVISYSPLTIIYSETEYKISQ